MGPFLLTLLPLFLAVTILMAGNGLLGTLVPLRGTAEGFSPEIVGLIGSAQFAGMLAGTWVAPSIIRRAGHIRAFAAYAAIAAIAALGFAIFVSPVSWTILRGVTGFCFAGLFSIIDGWTNAKATNQYRGRLLAMSNVVNFSGSAGGQQILRLDAPSSFTLFSAVGGLFMLALVPMALTTAEPPPPPAKGRLDLKGLYRTTPIAIVGILLVGVINATFWSLAPVYINHLGMGMGMVSNFMTAIIIGAAVGPYPIARLSDRMDRRIVIIAVALACAIAETAMVLLVGASEWTLYVLAFLLGLGLTTIYPLISAHTNDRAGRDGMLTIASTLLFIYCIGAIGGPVIAARLMTTFGDPALFAFIGTLHAALAAFVALRILFRGAALERVEAVITHPPEKPSVGGGRR